MKKCLMLYEEECSLLLVSFILVFTKMQNMLKY